MTSELLLELEPPPAPTLANFAVGRNSAVVEAVARLAAAPGTLYLWARPGAARAISSPRREPARAKRRSPRSTTRIASTEAAQVEAFDLFNRVPPAPAGDRGRAHGAAALPLREDLRSRLLSGLVFQLQPLADDEKAAALAAHAAARGMKLPAEAVDHLLRRLPRDLGTQFAVLDAVDRYSLALKRPVTLPLVREALRALAPRLMTSSSSTSTTRSSPATPLRVGEFLIERGVLDRALYESRNDEFFTQYSWNARHPRVLDFQLAPLARYRARSSTRGTRRSWTRRSGR